MLERIYMMLEKEKYIKLIKGNATEANVPLKLVTDLSVINKFEAENPNSPIGCISNEPFYTFRMDLYQNTNNNNVFRYCNVQYNKFGAASLVLFHTNEGTFILLQKSYRPFINRYVYEIPRGFADLKKDNSPLHTAIRELCEETSIDISKLKSKIFKLGDIFSDTGLTNNSVSLYKIDIFIDSPFKLQNNDINETISEHILIPINDINRYIPQINDSFTLCALCKALL